MCLLPSDAECTWSQKEVAARRFRMASGRMENWMGPHISGRKQCPVSDIQSCQPLHFGHSLLCPSTLHYAATLISLLFIFDCTMLNDASTQSVTSTKKKLQEVCSKDFPFCGLWDTIFHSIDIIRVETHLTTMLVEHNITLCAADHAGQLDTYLWEIELWRNAHMPSHRNMYTTLKIKLLHLKTDFATLQSGEGLAAQNMYIYVPVLGQRQ